MMLTPAKDICFVALPFSGIERPLLSFGLLQSILKKEEIKATTLYYNLDFADKIGVKNYHIMSQFGYIAFGDWVFSDCLFADTVKSDDYISRMHEMFHYSKIKPLPLFYDKDYLLKLRNIAHDFLKEKAEEVIEKYNPKIAACSSIFDNHIACVSFMKIIKELSPETITMIGGPNCEGEMGKTTHNLFSFVDYVVSGYADHLITVLCKKIFMHGKDIPADEVPDQVLSPIFREVKNKYTDEHYESYGKINMKELPLPDFDEYFNKVFSSTELRKRILPTIPIESSRGCYWGKCKFCGLNSNQMAYMQKNWEQVYEEITKLTEVHKIKKIEFLDNTIPFIKMSDMFDKLAHNHNDLQIFAEVRVDLRKEHLRKMREGGVIWIQPGIESLNDNFLQCMKKGSTMLQNIQIMKWARQYGINIVWTIMYNFPLEKYEWFDELSDVLPLVIHLQPPRGMTKLRFDRFSDYYVNQSQYGLDLKALEMYSYIYPYDQQTIDDLVYFFEDKKECRTRKNGILDRIFGKPERYFNKVNEIVKFWMKSFYSEVPFRLTYEISGENIAIYDSRPVSFSSNYILNKLEGEIFLFSDEVKSIEEIKNNLGSKYKVSDIENAVSSLIDKKIVLKHNNKLLALAIETPVANLPKISDFPCGTVLDDSKS